MVRDPASCSPGQWLLPSLEGQKCKGCLRILGANSITGEASTQEIRHYSIMAPTLIKKPNKPKQPKSSVSKHQNKGNQFRAGQWKQLYPPEDHGKNHFNASHRRSLYFAKFKTVSLQIYGNNVTEAKGCHFESKKAHFTVALMASDVKANYTPTRQERNQSQRGTLSWRHTHRSLESQHSFHTMLINDRLKQRMWKAMKRTSWALYCILTVPATRD